MVNGYTRQFWKELEEPTQSEEINTKKKHYAFRQTILQMQTSANCSEMSFQLIFIPDVKAMMSSHVGKIKHQTNAKLKTNSSCRHRSGSLNLIYMDSIIFKRNSERHFARMLNFESE